MQILTRDDLRTLAPSIFTRSPYLTMTHRYRAAITADVVDTLERMNVFPVMAKQSRPRESGRENFAKHLIRFRRRQDLNSPADEFPEVVLTNSFDGTSAYRLNAGLWRSICQNGLICPAGELGGVSVRHAGDDIDQRVADATYLVISQSVNALETVKAWKQITLTPAQQLDMAAEAMALKPNRWVSSAELLKPRRQEDQADAEGNRSLWVVVNVIEESMIRGGLHGVNERGRRITTKAVKEIDLDLRIHKGLWEIAQGMAELN